MHFERVVTSHQHIAAPITDADDERVDLEIGWCLPRAEDFQDSLLCIFVLDGRTLLTLVPSDHVLHSIDLLFHPGPSFGPRGGQGIRLGAYACRAIFRRIPGGRASGRLRAVAGDLSLLVSR